MNIVANCQTSLQSKKKSCKLSQLAKPEFLNIFCNKLCDKVCWQFRNDDMHSLKIRICTMIVFASTAQHAAVNFGQMDTYQFIPNATPCMMKKVHKKGEVSFS